jgi:hypothetical protein
MIFLFIHGLTEAGKQWKTIAENESGFISQEMAGMDRTRFVVAD